LKPEADVEDDEEDDDDDSECNYNLFNKSLFGNSFSF
jgi:hypothetical protein